MRKSFIPLCLLCLSSLCLIPACTASNPAQPAQTEPPAADTIDVMPAQYAVRLYPDSVYQTVEGFGASGAWWAQEIGGWACADDIMDLLYDDQKGIGLSIYRYNIGGGMPNIAPDPLRRAETLEVSPGVYDLSRDANALAIFKKAAERGADKNVLFVNSPPARMTVSGKTSGGDKAYTPNLNPDSEEAFAGYLADITALLLENGYPIQYVSPLNEPQWAWGGADASQEGCYYEPEQILRVGRAVALELQRRNLPVRLSLAESGQWYDKNYTFSLYTRLMADDVLKDALDHYAVHSYWSGETDKKMAAQYFSKEQNQLPLHQSEWCQMENGRDLGMTGALKLAKEIHLDMSILSVASWSFWTAVSGYDYNDGLIYVDLADKTFTESKRLWAFGQYSKFIKDGYRRIGVETEHKDISVSAYQSPDKKTTVVVALNETMVAQPLGLEGFDTGTTEVYITDETRDCRTADAVLSEVWNYALPPHAVVTFVHK